MKVFGRKGKEGHLQIYLYDLRITNFVILTINFHFTNFEIGVDYVKNPNY